MESKQHSFERVKIWSHIWTNSSFNDNIEAYLIHCESDDNNEM